MATSARNGPSVWVKGVGHHRGAPRVYFDGLQAIRAGFSPGDPYEVVLEGEGERQRVAIIKCPEGTRIVSAKPAKAARGARGDGADPAPLVPVVDINSKDLLAIFEGMNAIRVVVTEQGVYLLPLASERKKRERLSRLSNKLTQGQPLLMGSLSHGGGVLSHAIHQGLTDAGVKCDLAFANEIREDLLLQAMEHNDAWSPATMALNLPMQEAAQDDWLLGQLPKLEILELGLPCSGAGRAGRARRGLTKMEDHPEVGHLVFAALVILTKVQPAVVVLENVPLYAETGSAMILRHQLRDMGYECHEAVLEGKDFGSLEDRERWCLVAVTQGVRFNFKDLVPSVRIVKTVRTVLDPSIGPDDPRWRAMEYLKIKRERDAAKGSNFKMQIVDADDTSVPTLRKGYHKGGSTDPLLQHPEDPNLLRLFTAEEHARIKQVPPHLMAGLSDTIAHQLLGQGIVYEPFRAVGRRIGEVVGELIAAADDESYQFEQAAPRPAVG